MHRVSSPRESQVPRLRPLLLLTLLTAAVLAPVRAGEREIFAAPAQAKTDLAAGLQAAGAGHKRLIIDFGGNWCGDCRVLDRYFHDATNQPILDTNYVLVHINIGQMDQNLDIATQYQVPVSKGVPALAVLDENGRLLYSQRSGEFEGMRRIASSAVTEFLNKWKPSPGASNP
jgi:thioredoxin 1